MDRAFKRQQPGRGVSEKRGTLKRKAGGLPVRNKTKVGRGGNVTPEKHRGITGNFANAKKNSGHGELLGGDFANK